MKNVPALLKASAKEVQRLNANKIAPDIRFHYRLIAGALAMKAAALLPDNSEEVADVVNTAGLWVKDRDEKDGQPIHADRSSAAAPRRRSGRRT